MCDSAAHLVDHVLPDVPVRQWELTAPHEVRRVHALRPHALTAQGRIFVGEIARWQKRVGSAGEEARFRAAGKGPWVAEALGFNIHAGVMVRRGDREGLARLCRYGRVRSEAWSACRCCRMAA